MTADSVVSQSLWTILQTCALGSLSKLEAGTIDPVLMELNMIRPIRSVIDRIVHHYCITLPEKQSSHNADVDHINMRTNNGVIKCMRRDYFMNCGDLWRSNKIECHSSVQHEGLT